MSFHELTFDISVVKCVVDTLIQISADAPVTVGMLPDSNPANKGRTYSVLIHILYKQEVTTVRHLFSLS